jgi:hypothetical protein
VISCCVRHSRKAFAKGLLKGFLWMDRTDIQSMSRVGPPKNTVFLLLPVCYRF